MLVVNKSLKPKDVHGKKYRSPAFTMAVIFSIPFIILAIWVSLCIPPLEGRGVIIGLVCILHMALPVVLLLSSRKPSYIISEDKLYFFDSQVRCLQSGKREEPGVRTNGSVDYADIKGFCYCGIELKRLKYIVPPRVVIIGDDFEVEIQANKRLIKKLTS